MQFPNKKIPGVHIETVATARHSRRDLAQISLLKGAHQERIMPFLNSCPVLLMQNGEVLLHAGDSCDAIYLVLSGRLCMHSRNPAVPDVLIDAGDVVGELALFQKAIVGRTISAVEPSRVVVLERKNAWKLVGASHEIARNWLIQLAGRSRVSGAIDGNEELRTVHGGHPTIDETTGLHNRRWLESLLPRQMSRSTADNSPLGLLLVEIDGFDDYVKTSGQAAADHAVCAVAQALRDVVRPTDLLAAYGPAQFAVVLPGADGASACNVGERLRSAVSRVPVVASNDDVALSFTVSIGVAQFTPPTDLSAFLGDAEAALKMVKTSGGDRVGIRSNGDF